MVKRWPQWIAGGGAAVLAVFWIRSASVSSPEIELVGWMSPPAATEEVLSIEPPPGTPLTQTTVGLESASPPRVVPRRKLCTMPRRQSESHATKRPDCAPKTRRSAKAACGARCAGR